MVRGIRYVALDIKPNTPANLVGEDTLGYPEIPSVRGKLSNTESEAASFLEKLSKVDVADAVQSFKNVADDAHELLGSPHVKRAVTNLDDVTTKLNRVATEIEATTRELKPIVAGTARLMAPEGTIVTKLDATLEEVAASARALRRLADQLSRDPGSIVRGGRQ
jgi:ABC-type transporter Mla subunit MlaD